MKKLVACLVLLLLCGSIAFADTDDREIKIWVDDNYIFGDVKPLIVNSRTQVPVRFVAEALGFNVKWLADSREVIIAGDNQMTMRLKIGSDIATVGERQFKLDNEVFIEDGRTFLPLRFISESFGKNVDYDAATKTAIIGDNFVLEQYYSLKFFHVNYVYTTKESVRFTDNSLTYGAKNELFSTEQDLLYHFVRPLAKTSLNQKSGLIDLAGNVVVEPIYDYINYYDKGYFRFNKDGKMGLLDRSGNVIIAPQYDYLFDIENGYVRVEQDQKYGVLDLDGNVVIDIKYDNLKAYSDGYFVYQKDGKYGYITAQKQEIALPQYDYLSSFCKGVAVFKKGERYGMLNKQLDEIIERDYQALQDFYHSDITTYQKDGKIGLIDNAGNEITAPLYDNIYISDFISHFKGIIMATLNGKAGIIDQSGKVTVDFKYDFLVPIANNLIKYNIGGSYQHHEISGGKWGVIDKAGNEILPAQYDDIGYAEENPNNLIVGLQTGETIKYGIVNTAGKQIVALKYDEIHSYSDGLAIFSIRTDTFTGYRFGAVDVNGNIVLKPQYDYIAGFYHGVSAYGVNNQLETGEVITKVGLIDKKGNIIIEPIYDDIDILRDVSDKLYF